MTSGFSQWVCTGWAGLAVVLRSALSGGRVRIPPRFDAKEISAALRNGVTFASLVPTMLRRILEIPSRAVLRGSRAFSVGGGPIPDGLLERAAGAGLPVLASYGLTETCGQVATAKPGLPPSGGCTRCRASSCGPSATVESRCAD